VKEKKETTMNNTNQLNVKRESDRLLILDAPPRIRLAALELIAGIDDGTRMDATLAAEENADLGEFLREMEAMDACLMPEIEGATVVLYRAQ
jgi:hypothetical protein